jgi:glucuronokinase
VALGPDDLAEFAHAVERVDLAIAGGRQDSVCQAHGGLVFMDFAGEPPVAERLDPSLLPPLVVAWRVDSAEDSDVVHSDLRTRYRSRDAVVVGAMATLAAAARRARASLLGGDHNGFAQAVDATFDSRREILTLDPRHVEMVDIARRAGAAANYSGSGGSIVAVCRDASHCRSVTAGLMAAGCGATTATRARP